MWTLGFYQRVLGTSSYGERYEEQKKDAHCFNHVHVGPECLDYDDTHDAESDPDVPGKPKFSRFSHFIMLNHLKPKKRIFSPSEIYMLND